MSCEFLHIIEVFLKKSRSTLHFCHLPDLFDIETETGIIRTEVPLAGYAQTLPYILTVRGEDRGEPALYSQAEVRIFVEDLQSSGGQPVFITPGEDGAVITFPEVTDTLHNSMKVAQAPQWSLHTTVWRLQSLHSGPSVKQSPPGRRKSAYLLWASVFVICELHSASL